MRKSGIRAFCIILAFLILGTACTAAITKGFTDWNPYGWFDKIKEPEKPDKPDTPENPDEPSAPGEKTEAVTDGEGNAMVSGKVYNLSPRMLFASTTAENAETAAGITVQATIEPADADNKAVDWAVSFVNPASEWASGKTVTDYVTVTPESDGSLTATVKCLKAFGEQIKITVTSRDNSAATASCTADYYRRLAGIERDDIIKQNKETVRSIEVTNDGVNAFFGGYAKFGVGTLPLEKDPAEYLTFSAKFYSGTDVKERLHRISSETFIIYDNNYPLPTIDVTKKTSDGFSIKWSASFEDFCARTFQSEVLSNASYDMRPEVKRELKENPQLEMTLEVTATYDGQTVTESFKIPLTFNVNIGVTGINLDNSSLKF